MDVTPRLSKKMEEQNFKDTAGDICRQENTFNECVNPGEGAIFGEHVCKVHGLHENHPKIREAEKIGVVWNNFYRWIESMIRPGEKIILVAWNGATCDLRWLWKLTQAPNARYTIYPQVEYFMNPMRTIGHYKGFQLHPHHSKVESLELGCVWHHITGCNLNGAHDSLVDVRAQTDIVVNSKFVCYINTQKSISPITLMFSAEDQRETK